jgi:hypothetical protein
VNSPIEKITVVPEIVEPVSTKRTEPTAAQVAFAIESIQRQLERV